MKKWLSFEELSTSEENDVGIELFSDHVSEDNDDEYTDCLELHHEKTLIFYWVNCIICGKRMRESCTKCTNCRRSKKWQLIKEK